MTPDTPDRVPPPVHRSSFVEELKRRKVPRVVLVYLATAFALIEISDIVMPRLGLPEWTVTLVIVLAVLGLPIAIVLAWAFDLTPDGVRRAEEPAAEPTPSGTAAWASPRALFAAAALVLVGVSVGWFTGRGAGPAVAPPAAEADIDPSVAVLPFANLSEDAANEYFSDGLSEEILNVLAKVEGLKVAARTSAFAYKGRNEDIREIGEALGVNAVLEGSVRKAGDQVRVTAQLIQVSDGFHLWSQNYDRRLEDVFAIQEDIAHRISQALRVELGMELDRAPMTENMRAYELFLEARHLFHQRTRESLYRSIELYREAIEIDPDFAEAHVGLGLSYIVLPGYADPDFDATERAAVALERGLALDSTLALGHAALGNIEADRWDLVGAERQFARARALDPDDPTILLWHAITKLMGGRIEAGKADLRRAIEIDPASGVITGWLGHVDVLEGDPEAALDHYRRSIMLTWGAGDFWLCAVAALAERMEQAAGTCPEVSGPLRGRLDELSAEERQAALDDLGPHWLLIAPALGMREQFFAALEAIPEVSAGPAALSSISIWRPEAAEYRSDPRFPQWVEKIGMHEYWAMTKWPEMCSLVERAVRCR